MIVIRDAIIRTFERRLAPGESVNLATLPAPVRGEVVIVVVGHPGYVPDRRVETILMIGDGVQLEEVANV